MAVKVNVLSKAKVTKVAKRIQKIMDGHSMDLEDQLLRLKEEHNQLKKQAQASENRVKILNTKLSRIMNNNRCRNPSIAFQELIQDLHHKAIQFERENSKLRQKCILLRTKLSSCRSSSAYSHVRAKTDSGLNRPMHSPSISRPSTASHLSSNLMKQFKDNLKRLEEAVILPTSCIEEVLPSPSFTIFSSNENAPETLLTKSSNFSAQFIPYIENLRKDLLDTRAKANSLEKKLISGSVSEARLAELKQKNDQLSEENIILRDSLEKCIGSCLTELNPFTNNLNARINQLESEKQLLENSLAQERLKYEALYEQHQHLQALYENLSRESLWHDPCPIQKSEDRLQAIQRERDQVLKQFSDVKQMMDLVENNIIQ